MSPDESVDPMPSDVDATPIPLVPLRREKWFNPAFLKGMTFFLAGLATLAIPGISDEGSLHNTVGIILLLVGISDLWGMLRGHVAQNSRKGKIWIATSLLTGGILLVWPYTSLRRVVIILVIYAFIRSMIAFGRALSARRKGVDAPMLIWERAWVSLFLSLLLFVLPMTMLFLMITMAAAFSMVAGLVIIIYAVIPHGESVETELNHAQFMNILWKWLQVRDIGKEQRAKVAGDLYFEAPEQLHKIVSYVVMLVLSVSIATLAILQDSTAVVIGAMLVAPLMTPIMGCAAGLVAGWPHRVRNSFLIVVVSVIGAIGLSWILAAWIPALVPAVSNSQVLSRVSPTLLDMAIAIVAGAAGAYATVDTRVSSSLTGVAIAVALVPPLGVVGVTLQAGMYADALGAFLLFGTNLVSIILVSTLVFLLIGFNPIRANRKGRLALEKVFLIILLGALVIMIPLGFTGKGMLEHAMWQNKAQQEVQKWIAGESDLRVQQVRIRRDNSNVLVWISGSGQLPDIKDLEKAIIDSIGEPISITVEYFPTVIRRTFPESADTKEEKSEPVYSLD